MGKPFGEASSLPAGRQGELLDKQCYVSFNELEFTKSGILPMCKTYTMTAFRNLEERFAHARNATLE